MGVGRMRFAVLLAGTWLVMVSLAVSWAAGAAPDRAPQRPPAPATRPSPASAPASRPSADVPSYYVIPIVGALSEDAADIFVRSVDAARRSGATHVILVIDSEGGKLSQGVQPMLDQIINGEDLTWVAAVRNANVQLAALVLACPEVLVTSDARIGGLGNLSKSFKGEAIPPPQTASMRTAAQHAGRDELLVRALLERDIVVVEKPNPAGGPDELALVSSAPEARRQRSQDARVIKPRGQVLVLTADEAVGLGVATGTIDALPATTSGGGADGMEAIASALGIERWRPAGHAGRLMEQGTESQARREYMDAHKREIDQLDRRTRELEQEEKKLRTLMATAQDAKSEVHGGGARRVMGNIAAKREVRLAEVRRELQEVRAKKKQILAAAPR